MAKNDPTQSNNWPDDPDEPTAPTLPVIETPAPPASDNESQADEKTADATRISIPDRPTEKQASLARPPLGKTQLVPVEPGKNENHNAPVTPLPVNAAYEESGNHNAPTTPLPVDTAHEESENHNAPTVPIPSNGVPDEHTVYRRPANARPVIAVRNLTKTYILGKKTRVQALRGVSLEVYPGEFVTIMGPSGSGKSTFMNLLGCLDRPTSGEYWLAGELVSKLSNDQLAGMRNQLLGFVFQGFNLLGRATAVRNVALPMVYAGVPRRERERRARKVLHLVGLGGRLDHKPNELSGGQQQRVAIARALVNGPSLLLADEPTGNLDSKTSIEIMGVLQALNEQGLTIVLVTHDSKVAEYAKRQVAFLDGQIVRDEPVLAQRSAQKEWEALVSKNAGAAVGEEKP